MRREKSVGEAQSEDAESVRAKRGAACSSLAPSAEAPERRILACSGAAGEAWAAAGATSLSTWSDQCEVGCSISARRLGMAAHAPASVRRKGARLAASCSYAASEEGSARRTTSCGAEVCRWCTAARNGAERS